MFESTMLSDVVFENDKFKGRQIGEYSDNEFIEWLVTEKLSHNEIALFSENISSITEKVTPVTRAAGRESSTSPQFFVQRYIAEGYLREEGVKNPKTASQHIMGFYLFQSFDKKAADRFKKRERHFLRDHHPEYLKRQAARWAKTSEKTKQVYAIKKEFVMKLYSTYLRTLKKGG